MIRIFDVGQRRDSIRIEQRTGQLSREEKRVKHLPFANSITGRST